MKLMGNEAKNKDPKFLIFKRKVVMKLDDAEEKSIIEALRASPQLKSCILQMIDITDGES